MAEVYHAGPAGMTGRTIEGIERSVLPRPSRPPDALTCVNAREAGRA
jgi:hypothetical protein